MKLTLIHSDESIDLFLIKRITALDFFVVALSWKND